MCVGLAGAIGALWVVRKWRERQWGYCRSTKRLDGQTVIITGATAGLGRALAEDLAIRGAMVVLACRNFDKAKETIIEIKKLNSEAKMDIVELDLSSLSSVRSGASVILERYSQISFLVLNAGVSVPPDMGMKTQDGHEINFGTNHLGHFLLANLLVERMKSSKPSRIVVVSSKLHEQGVLDFEALAGGKSNKAPLTRRGPNAAYCNSKLANVIFAQEMARRLHGEGVNVYTVCPGWNYTQLFRYSKVPWFSWILILPVAFWFMKPAKIGIQTIIYCIVSEETANQTGLFYRDCREYKSQAKVGDDEAARLWELSCQLTNQ